MGIAAFWHGSLVVVAGAVVGGTVDTEAAVVEEGGREVEGLERRATTGLLAAQPPTRPASANTPIASGELLTRALSAR